MIELEYVENEETKEKVLYYRQIIACVDASGALCPSKSWTEWKMVSTITQGERDRCFAYENDEFAE